MGKNLKLGALLVAAALASGCTSVRPAFLPDGTEGILANCKGPGSAGKCLGLPGRFCGSQGYTIFNDTAEHGVVGSFTPSSGFVGTVHRNTLLFKCGH